MRGGQLALSCSEANIYYLNGKDVDGSKLNTLPSLKLHDLRVYKVFPVKFEGPRVVSVGRAAGLSALESAVICTGRLNWELKIELDIAE